MKIKVYAVLGWLIIPLSIMAKPSMIVDLSAVQTNGGVILTWTAPTPSAGTTLSNLDVRYDTSPINTGNWSSKPQVAWLQLPWTSPGTQDVVQTAIITTELTPNVTYYFAIKTQGSDGSWSTMSYPIIISAGSSTYSITLAWDPSPDATMTNYSICVGTASGTYDVGTNLVGNVTLGTVTGLTWGVTYSYAVIASDANGIQGYFSNELLHHQP